MEIYFLLFNKSPLPNNADFSKDPLIVSNLAKPYKMDFSDCDEEAFFWEHSDYDESTIKYIKLLECDSEFEKRIISIRKKFGIPKEGYQPGDITKYTIPFTSEKPLEEQITIINYEYEQIQRECLKVFNDYNIPTALKLSLYEVVISNSINISSEYKFKFELIKDEYLPRVKISIDLYAPIQSPNKIKKDLDKYWLEIQKLISENVETHKKLPDMPSIEIWNMRKRLNWSYKKIANVINKRYPLDMDESKARKRVDYMKKQYKKIYTPK